jgi:LAO/AO transport system kinase
MKNYKPKNGFTAQTYINGVLKRERVLLSREITFIESNLESDKVLAKEITQEILLHTGKSI